VRRRSQIVGPRHARRQAAAARGSGPAASGGFDTACARRPKNARSGRRNRRCSRTKELLFAGVPTGRQCHSNLAVARQWWGRPNHVPHTEIRTIPVTAGKTPPRGDAPGVPRHNHMFTVIIRRTALRHCDGPICVNQRPSPAYLSWVLLLLTARYGRDWHGIGSTMSAMPQRRYLRPSTPSGGGATAPGATAPTSQSRNNAIFDTSAVSSGATT